jgi:hypothetical protein
MVTSVCGDGAWRCPDDGVLEGDCWCYGPAREGAICTEQGFVFPDSGSGGGS